MTDPSGSPFHVDFETDGTSVVAVCANAGPDRVFGTVDDIPYRGDDS